MPIHEYQCPSCGRFDVLQKISSPALERHGACGAPARKLVSGPANAASA